MILERKDASLHFKWKLGDLKSSLNLRDDQINNSKPKVVIDQPLVKCRVQSTPSVDSDLYDHDTQPTASLRYDEAGRGSLSIFDTEKMLRLGGLACVL